ncbi:hypothetical protein POM88_022278 [Heracleum sosnowskyi]|uniref:Uncharacterized protein n=1 Tax=Heracleum sosnowskyi TaxID=360622 RepID=A0AAD8MUQ2_9APIA|nr:hypothetical protein POM88_022278 [Heracleum sosnowskyi]
MGSCFSKKTVASSSPTPIPDPPILSEQGSCKKNLFAIKYGMSPEVDCNDSKQDNKTIIPTISDRGCGIRTSSCTKEEVDAIPIQCGRLSNSGSSIQGGRNYSGSRRSFDFDNEAGDQDQGNDIVAEDIISNRIRRHRQRYPDGTSSPRQRRRRTLSRERGSGNGSGERRMSRSPARRSESPTTTHKLLPGNGDGPGKLVSVPASVSCNKSKNGGLCEVAEAPLADAIKRVQVKRSIASPRAQSPARTNVMASREVQRTAASSRAKSPARTTVNAFSNEVQRTAASPRAKSPARTNVKTTSNEIQRTAASPRARSPARTNAKVTSNEVQRTAASPRARSPAKTNAKATFNEVHRTAASPRAQSQTKNNAKVCPNEVQNSFSQRFSRKNDQSPYRRNPLCEIDTNISTHKHCSSKVINQAAMIQKSSAVVQGVEDKGSTNRSTKEQQKKLVQEAKGLSGNVLVNSQSLTRSRSPRPSTNSETSFNSSYATLLLKDIRNFHQNTAPAAAFPVPACVTKARSILDAVADLNSGTTSNTCNAVAKERTRNLKAQKSKKNEKSSLESKVVVSNDLMEPINETFTSM